MQPVAVAERAQKRRGFVIWIRRNAVKLAAYRFKLIWAPEAYILDAHPLPFGELLKDPSLQRTDLFQNQAAPLL